MPDVNLFEKNVNDHVLCMEKHTWLLIRVLEIYFIRMWKTVSFSRDMLQLVESPFS